MTEATTPLLTQYTHRMRIINQQPGLVLDPYSSQTLNTLAAPDFSQVLAILIGPEGGFSEYEVQLTQQHHCHPVQLGPRVLRTETAALAAITALQSNFGDLA
jgi:16S rRNA (uracil1498-N3)-methyltransferase